MISSFGRSDWGGEGTIRSRLGYHREGGFVEFEGWGWDLLLHSTAQHSTGDERTKERKREQRKEVMVKGASG
jgi:hypothetical protein